MTLLGVYLNSVEIKKLIVARSEEFQIPLKFICNDVGVSYDKFLSEYINSKDSSGYKITEDKFNKILNLLGLETRYTIVIKKDFNADEVRDNLRSKNA